MLNWVSIGFAFHHNITSNSFNDRCKGVDSTVACQPLAKSMLVIMVRGLFTKLRFPFVHFTCVNLTGEKIHPLFWEAVYRVERCEMKVMGATFDGVSANRHFLQLHGPTLKPGEVLYKVPNPHTREKQDFSRSTAFDQDSKELLVIYSKAAVGEYHKFKV